MKLQNYIPYGQKRPTDINTSTDKEIQIWQEFEMLRHLGVSGMKSKQNSAPFVDQAKTYYLDARNSNWKSAGLLYYYSFLNLAKSFLAIKNSISAELLYSTNFYHGLSAPKQDPNSILDFKIKIRPLKTGETKNIFASMYEGLTDQKWPFKEDIVVRVEEIIGYCDEISHEIKSCYQLERCNSYMQSILCDDGNSFWLEIVMENYIVDTFVETFKDKVTRIFAFNEMEKIDFDKWESSYLRDKQSLNQSSIIRFNQTEIVKAKRMESLDEFLKETNLILKNYIIPFPSNNVETNNKWKFIPEVSIGDKSLIWHPLLSNYLIAFMLGHLLRYHPQILKSDSKDSFISNAWCNQSVPSTLRYFLMSITENSVRINS